jgi:hypothetical protein
MIKQETNKNLELFVAPWKLSGILKPKDCNFTQSAKWPTSQPTTNFSFFVWIKSNLDHFNAFKSSSNLAQILHSRLHTWNILEIWELRCADEWVCHTSRSWVLTLVLRSFIIERRLTWPIGTFGYSICMASMQQRRGLSSLFEIKGNHQPKWSPFWSWAWVCKA